MPVIWPGKITFAVMGIKPRTFHFRVSYSPTQPNCSHILNNILFQLVYIHQNLKRQAAGRDNGFLAHGYKFCTCQFTFQIVSCPRHRILCDRLWFLKNYNLWSLCYCPVSKILCVKADFTKYCGTAYKAYALLWTNYALRWKLNYDGAIITEKYHPTLKDLQSKNSLIQWQFKIAGFYLCGLMFPACAWD